MDNNHNFFSRLVEYEYSCPIEPLFFLGYILVKIYYFPFILTQIQRLGVKNGRKTALAPEI